MNQIKTTIQWILQTGLFLTVILLALGSLMNLLGWQQPSQTTLLIGIWAFFTCSLLYWYWSLLSYPSYLLNQAFF